MLGGSQSKLRRAALVALIAAAVLAAGCAGTGGDDGPGDAEADDPGAVTGSGNETGSLTREEYDAEVQEARNTTRSFKKQLVGELQAAMQEGGPEAGIRVCAETAPAITANVSRQKGWKVTRVSRKYRNPVLGMPDAWEAETLRRFQQRAEQGDDLANMSRSRVVQEPGGEYVRVMSPLATQDLCLDCHGTDDRVSDEVQDLLDERYPTTAPPATVPVRSAAPSPSRSRSTDSAATRKTNSSFSSSDTVPTEG